MEKSEYIKLYKYEEQYWWYQALHELIEYHIKRIASFQPISIFDAGCGTGGLLDRLKRYGTVEGVDFSKEAIRFCTIRGLTDVRVADLNNWPCKKNHYDVVICIDVINHSGINDDMAVLHKIFNALKPGGVLILNTTAFECLRREHDKIVFTARRYKKKKLVVGLNSIGFKTDIATYRLPWLFLYILFRIYIRKTFKQKKEKTSDLILLPTIINTILLSLNRIENRIIIQGLRMPFGSSLFIVAGK